MSATAHRQPGWQQLAKRVVENGRALDLPCVRCGGPIDYQLHGNHRMGPTADHLDPLGWGGDLLPPITALGPAHRACNSKAGSVVGHVNKKRKQSGYASAMHNMQSAHSKQAKPASSVLPASTPTQLKKPAPDAPRGTGSGLHIYKTAHNPPRILSDPHPDEVDTLGPLWAAWIKSEFGMELRPWQRTVLDRALGVDSDGRLVRKYCIVSTSRQSGKSLLLRALAVARASHADHFGEPQQVLHVSRDVASARRIMLGAVKWARDRGMTVRLAQGQEEITWPDGSSWIVSSEKGLYGHSASTALADEAWDLSQETVSAALLPTLVEREQSQLWLLSTAHAEATPTMLEFRRRAIEGDPSVMIAEWSAPPGADLADPETWRAASAYWTKARHDLMAGSVRSNGFAQMWCNQWPDAGTGSAGWPVGFASGPRVQGPPPHGAVAALEVGSDRSRYGTAVAAPDGSEVAVWTSSHTTLEEALAHLEELEPAVVLVGQSLKNEAVGPFNLHPVGVSETRQATPVMADLVSRGRLRHDHSRHLLEQSERARVTPTESGDVLSAKRSHGQISALKAAVWAVWAVSTGQFAVEESEIW